MAKKTAAVAEDEQQQEGAALAVAGSSALATVDDPFDLELDSDGLEEIDRTDYKFPILIWNQNRKREGHDEFLRVDNFFSPVDDLVFKRLRCIMLSLHKTNSYSFFDNAKDETVRVCRSFDRRTGRLISDHPKMALKAGAERDCEGCPDAQWQDGTDGKRTRPCFEVYGVLCIHVDENGALGEPFMLQFKKTSLAPFRRHLQRYHIGKRRVNTPNGRVVANQPLFSRIVTITLEADKGGKFALPIFSDVTPITDRDLALELQAMSSGFKAHADKIAEAADAQASKFNDDGGEGEGGGSGGSLNQDDFV